MIVTINTDASYSDEHKLGAYAYWTICNSGKLFARGGLMGEVKDSSVAELMSVVKAIHRLANSNWKNIDKIIINTDCMVVINYMIAPDPDKLPKRLKKKFDPICDIYNKLIRHEKLIKADIEFRHVKAHTRAGDARSHVNRWCDNSAKLSLREMIEKKHSLTLKNK